MRRQQEGVKLSRVLDDAEKGIQKEEEPIIDEDPLFVARGREDLPMHVPPGTHSCLKRHFKSWWTWEYLFDWVLLLGCTLTELAIMELLVKPPERYLPQSDPSFSYPYLKDIYPSWALAFPVLFAILVFALFQFVMKSVHDFHHATLGLVEAVCFTLIFTDVVKVVAGRYRPDWYDRAGESESVIRDGRESFPSGHSSISFAAMVFLSLYLTGKVGLFRDSGGAVWKAFLCILPTGFSTAIAVTRVRDYHHHFSDILAGSILGSLLAIFAYLLNFHAPTSNQSHLPKKRTNDRALYYSSLPYEQVRLGIDS